MKSFQCVFLILIGLFFSQNASAITISGDISFPNSGAVTAFTRNVLVVAQNPLNVSDNQILSVPFNVGQRTRAYEISLPNNGHDWIISYQCSLCNQEGILTTAYVGVDGMVTQAEQARVLAGDQSIDNIDIELIGGTTIGGDISFPNSGAVTAFTRNVLVVAQNPLNVSDNQILNVPFNVGQRTRAYEITLPNNGHDWIISYQCSLCNQEGILTTAYVGVDGMVTQAEQARVLAGDQSIDNIDIELIGGTTISGDISFPNSGAVTAFTRNVLVVAQNPLNVSDNQILNVPFNVGQRTRAYEITLPNNGHDWIISYQCSLCNQEGILTTAYVGVDGMVTQAEQARVLPGSQNSSNINIFLVGEVMSDPAIDATLPSLFLLLLED